MEMKLGLKLLAMCQSQGLQGHGDVCKGLGGTQNPPHVGCWNIQDVYVKYACVLE